jgi:hypothetical protein
MENQVYILNPVVFHNAVSLAMLALMEFADEVLI